MAFKAILLCASALLVQSIYGNCIKSYSLPSCGCSPCLSSGYPSSLSNSLSSPVFSGGEFIVTSSGPISPSGIAVKSELSLAGDLNVCGKMPFLSAVAFDTCLPTSGSGSVDYSCGCDSNVGITNYNGCSSNLCGCGRCG